MGGDQAASVLSEVKQQRSGTNSGAPTDEDDLHFRNKIRNQYELQSTAHYSSSRLWDDGIIDPIETRALLIRSITVALRTPVETTKFGVFRM